MTPSRRSVDALRLILVGLLCQAVLSCAASVTPASAAPPSSRMSPAEGAAAIGAIVREEIAAGHLPGAVVVVGVDDKVVLRQAYGERAVLPGRSPATVDTIYDAASLTKVMATAVAIQQLAERGKIDLDKPAATYWPAFAANGKAGITVRQLLTHYAGLPAGIPTRSWSGTEGALDTIVALKPLAPAGTRQQVLSGIDVLEGEGFRQLEGRRIGLITNGSARDAKGRRTADVLHAASGPKLVALFSPEHGFDTAAMLTGLDGLVFDMQDVGTRYYTYATTMAYAMEAAAEQKLDFFVLDRPNPITASTVQGPVLDADLVSFITYLPLPVRHGMTIGELARLFNEEKKLGTRLHVIRMRHYDRASWFDQTGFAWVAPSPNLRRLEQVVLYPGVAMVEAANVSVGRGTDSPFELLGAPWIDGKALAQYLEGRAIAGVRFESVTFTPREWAFAGQACQGVRLLLTDRGRLDSALLGIELLAALQRLQGDRFAIDRTLGMIGSRESLAAIKALGDPREIAQTWQPALDGFRARRATSLLY